MQSGDTCALLSAPLINVCGNLCCCLAYGGRQSPAGDHREGVNLSQEDVTCLFEVPSFTSPTMVQDHNLCKLPRSKTVIKLRWASDG